MEPGLGPAHELVDPPARSLPVVVASPHSGQTYPLAFIEASRLDPITLRRSEDSFVDELFGGAVAAGAPLLRALYPRAYVDLNREPFELDPAMFEDELPAYCKTRSPRIAAGLGTVARVVGSGQEIYARKLRFSEVFRRITALHQPYHAALTRLVGDTHARFGHCVLIDAHSMPSSGSPVDWECGATVDFVLGDCHGTSCAAAVMERAAALLSGWGYTVARNEPYPGGYTTRHYGRPDDGVHALQIEVNRSLYMNEITFERGTYLPVLHGHLAQLVETLGRIRGAELAP